MALEQGLLQIHAAARRVGRNGDRSTTCSPGKPRADIPIANKQHTPVERGCTAPCAQASDKTLLFSFFFYKFLFTQSFACLRQSLCLSFKQYLTLQNKFSSFCSLPLVSSKLVVLQIFLFLFCCLLCKYRGEETGPEEKMSHPNGARCPFVFHCWAQSVSLYLQSVLHM